MRDARVSAITLLLLLDLAVGSVLSAVPIDRNAVVTAARQKIGDHYKWGMHFPRHPGAVTHPYTFGVTQHCVPLPDWADNPISGVYDPAVFPQQWIDESGQTHNVDAQDLCVYKRDCVSWANGDGGCRNHGHFDCSGLVWWVFDHSCPGFFDGSVPQINADYRNVSRLYDFANRKGWLRMKANPDEDSEWDGWDEMEPGDWVIFNNCGTKAPQHIGIFVEKKNVDIYPDKRDLRRYWIVICDGGPAWLPPGTAPDEGMFREQLDGHAPGVRENHMAHVDYHCTEPSFRFKHVYPAGFVHFPTSVPTRLTCTPPTCSCDGNAIVRATLTRNDTNSALPEKNVCFFVDGQAVGCGATNGSGEASVDLGAFRSLKPGSHSFYAKFDGDNEFVGSESGGCTFDAPAETQMTCAPDPAEIECEQELTLTAVLKKESDTNVYDLPLADADVVFTITKSGGDATSRTAKTNASGVATVTLRPESAGVYDVTAIYAGSPVNCICGSDATCSFRVWAKVTVSNFLDCDMSGRRDNGEPSLAGWPLRLFKVAEDGALTEMTEKVALPDNVVKFTRLEEGRYKVVQGSDDLAWTRVPVSCGGVGCAGVSCGPEAYCDLRASWDNKRWLFTKALLDGSQTAFDSCSGEPVPSVGPFQLLCAASVAFGNVPLGTVTAFKYHDLNMNGVHNPAGESYSDLDGNGVWTPGEAFTDLDCNGAWDPGEFFVDANKNEIRDAGDPFTDTDGDKLFDYPECPVQDWPFALEGCRRDGKPICPKGITDANGVYVFLDVPPAATCYTLREDAVWTQVALPSETVYRTSQIGTLNCGCGSETTISRWEATTPIQVQFPLDCGANYSSPFGNVCLATVDGVKEVYTQGMPGQAEKDADASGWHICLAGKDVKGRDVAPTRVIGVTGPDTVFADPATKPIDIPCLNPTWYQVETPADGSFHFLDLPPGHYHLTEQPDHPGFRLDADRSLLCGFDVRCCPEEFILRNIKDGIFTDIYQAYCGTSNGNERIFGGLKGLLGDPITAVPGILCICPGPGWQNYVRATDMCREAKIRNVTLHKQYDGNEDCPDYFRPVDMWQQGSKTLRYWWPLMYEPPMTNWTLSVIYDTATPVQFPGETQPATRHQDVWQWKVVSDIEHMKLFIDLIHELPFGSLQVPIISDEVLYRKLKAQLDEIDTLAQAGQKGEAGMKLDTFILDVEDACLTSDCIPAGIRIGIANTIENPACCKLLLDADYVGKMMDLWNQ